MKRILILLTLIISACSKPYDYQGSFSATKTDNCIPIDKEKNHTMIVISTSGKDKETYSAKFSASLAGDLLPLESGPANPSEDGSITFNFVKEAKSGVHPQPSVNMQIQLIPKDENHIIVTEFPISISVPNNPNLDSKFDFVNDNEFTLAGKTMPNEFSKISGNNGLCLKRN